MTDVRFYETEGWTQLFWMNSGGTRAKRILQDTEGNQYYFKRSEKKEAKEGKPEKYYKYEFWSEVIAYQLGHLLGLNVLRYDVAEHEGVIGCLSPTMNKLDEEQLLEVGRYMTALNPDFLPNEVKTRNEYTFELLIATLNRFNFTKYLTDFLEIILFDAIIGNTDRHQENWAFIGNNTTFVKAIEHIEVEVKRNGVENLGWLIKKLYSKMFDKDKNELSNVGYQFKLQITNISKMTPIYDNGSSMARELTDERVSLLLFDNQEFNKYINGGKAEIHWKKRKVSHFELVDNLKKSPYLQNLNEARRFLVKWDNTVVTQIVNNIDDKLPEKFANYRIPKERKELIIKLLISRYERLIAILSD